MIRTVQESKAVVEFSNEDIVITDPAYFMKDAQWNQVCGRFDHLHENSVQAFTRVFDGFGYTKYIVSRTGYGDGDFNVMNMNTLSGEGVYGVDSGCQGVFILSEVLANCAGTYDVHKEVENGLATIIRGFTGEVTINHVEAGEDNFYQIIGTGNINFVSSPNYLTIDDLYGEYEDDWEGYPCDDPEDYDGEEEF